MTLMMIVGICRYILFEVIGLPPHDTHFQLGALGFLRLGAELYRCISLISIITYCYV